MENGNAWNASFRIGPKRQNVWGWAHASEFFALGLGGALVLTRLLFGAGLGRWGGVEGAYLLGVLLVAAGGLVLIADLGKPGRFLRAAANLRHSWISWGVVADGVFLLGGLALVLAGGPAWVAWVTGAAALFVVVYPGLAMAASPSIPFWNTALLPLEFGAYSFAGAGALCAWLGPGGGPAVAVSAVSLALALSFTLLHLLGAHLQRGTARMSAGELVHGVGFLPLLVLGVALPLVVALLASGGAALSPGLWAVAAILALAGSWASKFAVLRVGYYAQLF